MVRPQTILNLVPVLVCLSVSFNTAFKASKLELRQPQNRRVDPFTREAWSNALGIKSDKSHMLKHQDADHTKAKVHDESSQEFFYCSL